MSLIRKNRIIKTDELTRSEIQDFIINKYNCFKTFEEQFKIYKLNNVWYVDSLYHLYIKSYMDTEYLTNGLFEFNIINGDFNCWQCPNLKSLIGGPKIVKGNMSCDSCGNLKTLEGAPEIVKNFYCSQCQSLKNLYGAPKSVDIMDCSGCTNLNSLEGAPEHCRVFICLNCDNLIDLKYAPKSMDIMDCSGCHNLISLGDVDITRVKHDNCPKLKL